MTTVRRLAIVIAVGLIVLSGIQLSLTRDDIPPAHFVLTASADGADAWTFTTDELGDAYPGRPRRAGAAAGGGRPSSRAGPCGSTATPRRPTWRPWPPASPATPTLRRRGR